MKRQPNEARFRVKVMSSEDVEAAAAEGGSEGPMLEGEARDAEEVGVASEEPEALSDLDVAAETPSLPTEPTTTSTQENE